MRLSNPASFFCRAARSFVALMTASTSLSFQARRAAGDSAVPSALAPAFDFSTSSSFSSASCRAEIVPIVFAVAAFARHNSICFLCSSHHWIARLTSPRFSSGGAVCDRERSFGRFRRSLVILDHPLNAVLRIATRANQILLRVIDFVLIQFFLRVRDVGLIFQRIFLISGGLRDRRVQLRDLRLRGRQPVLRLLQARLNFFRFRAQRWRMQRRIAQRGGECDVHFVIGQANRFRREFLFSRQRRQRRKLLRDFQRSLIDDLRLQATDSSRFRPTRQASARRASSARCGKFRTPPQSKAAPTPRPQSCERFSWLNTTGHSIMHTHHTNHRTVLQ